MNIDTKEITEGLHWLGWDDDDVRRTVTQLHKGFRLAQAPMHYFVELHEASNPCLSVRVQNPNHSWVEVTFMNKFTGKVWFHCYGEGINPQWTGSTPVIDLPDDFDFRAIGYLADRLATNNLVGYQMHLMRTNHYPSWSRTGKKHETANRPGASHGEDRQHGDGEDDLQGNAITEE